MRTLLIISLLFAAQMSFAQYQELFNQTIEVVTATQVETNLKGEIQYQQHAGSFLLIESKVVVENCNGNIFKSFIKEKRYIVDVQNDGDTIVLQSHKNLGRVLKTSLGETKETVYYKIYFPEGFKDQNGHPLVSTITHEQVDTGKR